MKLFRILPLVVGSAAAGILASTSPAHALDFNFTFTGNDGNTVSGTIYGLQDNTISDASNVVVTSVSKPGQSGANLDNSFNTNANEFTVSNGVLTNANFYRYQNTPIGIYLLLNSDELDGTNYYAYNSINTGNIGEFAGVTYSSASATVPFDIPGGPTIPTLGSLLALAGMRKVRHSIASKTCIAKPVTATVS